MEMLALFIATLIGAIVGWHVREYHAMKTIDRILKSEEFKEAVKDEEETRTKMRLEKHHDIIYAFSDEDDSFIAQGKDLLDLDQAIRARFPDKKFSVQEQNLIDIKAEYHESV